MLLEGQPRELSTRWMGMTSPSVSCSRLAPQSFGALAIGSGHTARQVAMEGPSFCRVLGVALGLRWHPPSNSASAGGKASGPPVRRGHVYDADTDSASPSPTIDSLACQLAHVSVRADDIGSASAPIAGPDVVAHASLEDLLPGLARRVAWSQEGRKGALALEIGSGRLAGTTLVISVHDGRISVDMDMPSSAPTATWQERISSRLSRRGLDVDRVEVR